MSLRNNPRQYFAHQMGFIFIDERTVFNLFIYFLFIYFFIQVLMDPQAVKTNSKSLKNAAKEMSQKKSVSICLKTKLMRLDVYQTSV